MLAEDSGPAVLGVERSLSGKRWRARLTEDRAALAIAQRHGLPEIVGRVLAGRGVDPDGVPAFLDPRMRDFLPDPSSFLDMDRAAARLAEAVTAGEGLAIFGDYDVDGATAAALLKRFFAAIGVEARVHIPDRQREGYGPSETALLGLGADGARVIVTVDCGTAAHGPLAAAARAGIDVIVVDHHVAEADLPEALAVVNPNRLDEAGHHTQLAAVGVAFLLAVAVNRALRAAGWYAAGRIEPDLMQWLDLVALGTVCDVVPLTGVNRALVTQGLKVMAGRANTGLAALADVAGIEARLESYHAGFVLGPRINAGGRVGEAGLGAQLLASDEAEEALAIARRLDELNGERREIEAQVLEAAITEAEDTVDEATPIILLGREGWHPGVIGIVAARLRERFNRPACVVAFADGIGRGSGRSVEGFALGPAIIAARQAGIVDQGGGHAMAAGFSIEAARMDELRAFLGQCAAAALNHGPGGAFMVPGLGLDGALSLQAANLELVEILGQVGPFGIGNPRPRFGFAGISVVKADIVGADHVRCVLAEAASGGGRLDGIAFRAADSVMGQALLHSGGVALHLAGHLNLNEWRGRRSVQMVIEDAARAQG